MSGWGRMHSWGCAGGKQEAWLGLDSCVQVCSGMGICLTPFTNLFRFSAFSSFPVVPLLFANDLMANFLLLMYLLKLLLFRNGIEFYRFIILLSFVMHSSCSLFAMPESLCGKFATLKSNLCENHPAKNTSQNMSRACRGNE